MMKKMTRILAALAAAVLMLSDVSAALAEEEKVYTLPVDMSGGMPYDPGNFNWNDEHHHYEDPTIVADYYKLNGKDYGVYHVHYVEVTIKHGSQLRTACADPKTFISRNMRPAKAIANRVNAVVAVDGDFCNSYYANEGSKFCLRQGTVYRDTVVDYLDMLLIDEDGDFHVYKGGPELADLPKEEINGKKINNAFQFGPAIVIDGEPVPDEYILDPAHAPDTSKPDKKEPRICIAQIDTLHYLIFFNWWGGLTLSQVRDAVMGLAPVKTAYMLDGGNSSQIIFQKSQANLMGKDLNDRKIFDIIYFASAYDPEQ